MKRRQKRKHPYLKRDYITEGEAAIFWIFAVVMLALIILGMLP